MKKQELESRITKLEEEVIYLRGRIMELEAQRVPYIRAPYFPYPAPCFPYPPPPVMTTTGTGTKDDLFCGRAFP